MGGNGCDSSSYGLVTDVNGGLQFYIADQRPVAPSRRRRPKTMWDGKWHHVAGTFDGSKVRFYVDGKQMGSGTTVAAGTQIDYSVRHRRDGAIGGYRRRLLRAHAEPPAVTSTASRSGRRRCRSTPSGTVLKPIVTQPLAQQAVERCAVGWTSSLGARNAARPSRLPRPGGSPLPELTTPRYHAPSPRGLRVVFLRLLKRRMKTYVAKPTDRERNWLVVDAEGQTLGRLATQIADALRGKRKPTYTPHIDTGDFVVVVNAEKISVTGQKRAEKMYYRHSGYPGGLKSRTLNDMLERRPEEVIRLAVKGMMPRNRLSRKQLTKLKVYAGPDHPHVAQQPQPMALIKSK